MSDLEAEVYSTTSNYSLDVDYKEVLKYFDNQNNKEYNDGNEEKDH